MTKSPSRLLNEQNSLMGLSILDIATCGYVLIFSHQLLTAVHLELLSFVIAIIAVITLMRIRQSYRSKIIRDFVAYMLTKKLGIRGGGLE